MSTDALSSSSAMGFLQSINPLALLGDAKTLTPHEFLRDFYTQRGDYDKLKDVDALVAAFGHQMPLLYAELDKKYQKYVVFFLNPSTELETQLNERLAWEVVLLGNSGVGKTNLISRLHKGEFNDEFASTIGVEFLTHAIKVDNVDVKAQIWDTAGQERFHAMMATYYRKAAGALLIFDVGNRASLMAIERWLDQLLNVAEPGLHATLIGNKCDLSEDARAVTTDEARQFAAAHHMAYIETSAKTGLNVQEAFHDLIEAIHRARVDELPAESTAIELGAKKTTLSSFFDCKFV
ncbi:hypothetical protein BBJ28_00015626 [Nothophytophthora sp. Chile5]|nr:hypothetical protein BBJ28_00015626 [Nothophytophthora sp. Chile5]